MASLRHALIRSFLIKRGPDETTKRLLTLSSALNSELRQKQIDLLSKYPGGCVDLEKNDKTGIAVLTLNNPTKKNALTGSMMIDFEKRVEDLESWEKGRGVIFKGSGNTFCSGADLNVARAVGEGKDSGHPSLMSSFMQNITSRFFNLPLITVALVEGAALGGGAELVTCCDFRVVSSSANIGFVQARMGLSPGWGGGVRLVNLLGRLKALQLLSSASIIKGFEAQEIGLADEIFGEFDDSLETATSFLTNYTKFAPDVIKAMKRVVINASRSDMQSVETLNTKETQIFQSLCGGLANLEALNKKSKF
ncbi:hypothetical protein HELRODRAFT_159709 [Helobdella robusta]|uniref:Ethylmalonyl-CoA decarboxylase n=1 Tax=Helobdella robusta TaxID=6412 RepID=T1EPC1_HELRO|nr:hypothetical protein HELRODRAFT_159709 [Helobdella robusta]ESO13102.1 hypothetical protein HELRODRAFT_159709 [Helobdella robusta]